MELFIAVIFVIIGVPITQARKSPFFWKFNKLKESIIEMREREIMIEKGFG